MSELAILLPDLRGGGAERMSLDLAQEFERLGHRVEFILMRARGEFLADAQAAFTVRDLGCERIRQVPFALARYLRTRPPTAVIANMWPLTVAAVMGRAISGHDKCRLLLVEHNTLSRQYASRGRLHNWLMKGSLRVFYRKADRLAGVSEGVARDLAALGHLPNRAVEVLHNPIPRRRPASEAALRDAEALWDCPPGARLLTVGSLKAQKNHRLLLEAFARLDRPEARLMLVGKGDREGELRRLAAELGVSDQVIFAGFRSDPTPFYLSADLFVLSSDYEGLSVAIIEALSCGLPVVSTDCPSGPRAILANGRYGRLVPVGDAESLARAMAEALLERLDRAELEGRAADFAPEIAARKYLDLLFPEDMAATR